MAERIDKTERSRVMAAVHSKNTKPEIIVRKLLHSLGYRFRLHRTDLPGKPDVILPKYKLVIFVHGCFWHGCPSCKHAKIRPQNNSEYWNRKLDRNKERDTQNLILLESIGWSVLVIWECETRKSKLELLSQKLQSYINSLNKAD